MKKFTEGYIDIHSHILPNIDDGAKDMEMSLKMLDIAYAEGIRGVVVTPHYHPGKSMVGYSDLISRFEKYKTEIEKRYSDMKLYLGREVYYTSDVIGAIKNGEHLGMIDNHYILLEYSPEREYSYIRRSIYEILQQEYIPIIAHVERCEALIMDIERIYELREMGALIQINAAAVDGKNGTQIKKYVRALLKEELVDFIATDAHSAGTRSPRLRTCAMYIEKKYGKQYAEKIMKINPDKIINGEKW